jgi:hypothetical protein
MTPGQKILTQKPCLLVISSSAQIIMIFVRDGKKSGLLQNPHVYYLGSLLCDVQSVQYMLGEGPEQACVLTARYLK